MPEDLVEFGKINNIQLTTHIDPRGIYPKTRHFLLKHLILKFQFKKLSLINHWNRI